MKKLLLASAALLCVSGTAEASVIPVLDTVTLVGTDYEFSYSGTLAGDVGLVDGSTLVIFDFAGYVADSISAGIYAADIDAFTELTSTLPLPPTDTDDPTIANLVFRWKGSPFNASGGPFADVSFSGLTARSVYSEVTRDAYSAFVVSNNGAATGEPAWNSGRVGVASGPPVPEPATWALMIAGFGMAGAMLRRRQGLATF